MTEDEARAALWREGLATWGDNKLARKRVGWLLKKAKGNVLVALQAVRYARAGNLAGVFDGDVTPIVVDQIKAASPAPRQVPTRALWAKILQAWHLNHRWDWTYGPDPAYEDCWVPKDLLTMTRAQLKAVSREQHTTVAEKSQLSML